MNRLLPTAALVAATAGVLAGCPGTATTTTYTPLTGIVIRGASLVAGVGCGTGAGQVYKYAAVLTHVDDAGIPLVGTGEPQYSGVFDCFADGVFSNLPADPSGGLSFRVSIFAWNRDAFPEALQCEPCTDDDGGLVACPGQALDASFNACPGDDPGTVLGNQGTPTWSTFCSATQQSGVSVLAVCDPLARPPGFGGGDAGEAGP